MAARRSPVSFLLCSVPLLLVFAGASEEIDSSDGLARNNALTALRSNVASEDIPSVSLLEKSSEVAERPHKGRGKTVPASGVPKTWGLTGCLEDPFATFRAAFVAMLLCISGLVSLCVLLSMPARAMLPEKTLATPRTPRQPVFEPAPTEATTLTAGRLGGSPPRLGALEGLKTLMLAYIIVCHWSTSKIYPLQMPGALAGAFSASHLVLQGLFVLIGFMTYEEEFGKVAYFDRGSIQSFSVRRLARLCPAHFAALLCTSALAAGNGWQRQPFLSWPMEAMFLQSLLPVTICGSGDAAGTGFFLPFGGNYVGWFVSALVLVTLSFPFLYNARPRSGPASTAGVLFCVLALRSVPTLLEMSHRLPCPGVMTLGFGYCKSLYIFAPMRLLEFAAGAFAAQLAAQLQDRASAWNGWCWLSDLFLVATIAAGFAFNAEGLLERQGEHFMSGIFCLMCMSCRLGAPRSPSALQSKGILGRVLSSQPLTVISPYSYSAYMFSLVVLVSRPSMPLACWWVPLVANWVLAAGFVHLVEGPAIRGVERRLQRSSLLRKT